MFKHYLITRFNLKKSDWKTNKNKVDVLTDEWHKNRFDLFLNFCVPSVMSQTNTNFEWLVFFDTSTKDEFRTVIKNVEQELTNFKPFFVDGMDAFLPSIKSYINSCSEDYIITSRLDNDDCLGQHYINSVQKKFNGQDFMAIDYIKGYTLQILPEVKLGFKLHQYNPFTSLIEINKDPKTIWSIPHNHWKYESNILQIKDESIWTSIIHEENKVNKFTGFGNVTHKDFFKDFKISKEKMDYVDQHIKSENKWKLESIANYISSYWSYHFKNLKKRLGFYNNRT
ncbi:glycosyltransferase [Winogradskyella sp.]|uniref:glycosyltransferase n=1 Tax=Winogradskyella sp. TaxID=1883156 RepID=UPI002632543F|nr:glycosyltransferase [Winogradskyella sp.]